ncbi:MAG: Nif3-like dinuclear metal center hexameric protein [Clostridia bacterium]|nr:Nif3-like dinuclear metal center hexameric protein [Clostridia bacterium]
MKIKEITDFLDDLIPLDLAEEWDNVGLQLGNTDLEATGVLVSLDFTEDVLDNAIKNNCNLIVTHHPVIFKPLYSLTDLSILKAIENKICVYSAHTNLDVLQDGVNDVLAKYLELTEIKADGILRVGKLKQDMTSEKFVQYVKDKLSIPSVRVSEFNNTIKTVGVVGGSGGDFLELAIKNSCDAFVTGEASYHLAETAKLNNIMLLCAGHYETEVLIVEHLKNILKEKFNQIKIINGTNHNPFRLI